MASQLDPELISSLKDVLYTGQYADLQIKCGEEQFYNVHKVIVCPRSHLLTKMCSEIGTDDESVINLTEDDPQAVDLMIQFLYTHEYPQVIPRVPELAFTNGNTNSVSIEEPKTNGHHVTSPPTPEYSREREEFIEPTANENKPEEISKKKKKKKRTMTMNGAETKDVAPQVASNLAIHAKVYKLGSKYGIKGLKTLSAEKFEKELESHWDTDDFLNATQEAYKSSGEQDRTIRDAVLNAIKHHPDLLARKQVQDVIKGLELSFELLMHHIGASNGHLGK